MTETTLRVRMAYKASGYEPVLIHHVADDHIALELDFLASLADHAVDCAVAGNEDTAREYLKTSKKFLNEHLGVWVSPFADDLERLSGSEFYAAAAQTLRAIVEKDANWL